MEQCHGLGILELNIAKEEWHYSDDFGVRSPAVPKIFEPRSACIPLSRHASMASDRWYIHRQDRYLFVLEPVQWR